VLGIKPSCISNLAGFDRLVDEIETFRTISRGEALLYGYAFTGKSLHRFRA